MIPRLTIHEAAEALRKSERWLHEWLRSHPADRHGRPFYARAGRTKIFTAADIDRIDEAMRESQTKLGKKKEFQRARTLLRITSTEDRKELFRVGPGFVYFVEAGDCIKIGFTTSLSDRLPKIATGTSHKLVILHTEPGLISDEKQLHQQFAEFRVRREWFRKAPELLAYIEQRKARQHEVFFSS